MGQHWRDWDGFMPALEQPIPTCFYFAGLKNIPTSFGQHLTKMSYCSTVVLMADQRRRHWTSIKTWVVQCLVLARWHTAWEKSAHKKSETFTQCGFDVGPTMEITCQHQHNIGSPYSVLARWPCNIKPTLAQRLVFTGYELQLNAHFFSVHVTIKIGANRTGSLLYCWFIIGPASQTVYQP